MTQSERDPDTDHQPPLTSYLSILIFILENHEDQSHPRRRYGIHCRGVFRAGKWVDSVGRFVPRANLCVMTMIGSEVMAALRWVWRQKNGGGDKRRLLCVFIS